MTNSQNPLAKFFRQPAIYTTLPSNGDWYPEGSLVFDNEKELAVYPMTAKDEMTMNTPDALLNGESTVGVIRSCVPGIKDPWMMPVLDLDAVMIAIRIATYGHMMDIVVSIPNTEDQVTYNVDLRTALDKIDKTPFDGYVPTDTVSFKIKPMSYRQLTNLQLRTYEQQRIISQVIETVELNPTQKQEKFAEIFGHMTNLTLANMKESILEVTAEGQTITDRVYIEEFVDNMDGTTADKIKKSLDAQSKLGKIDPVVITPTSEQIEKGAPKTFDAPISMDNSNFFVSRS